MIYNQRSEIDLHMHSSHSDGELTPRELLHAAHQQGLKQLALTDHDTLAGVVEAQALGRELGIRVITGIEISVVWQGIDLHVLGLAINVLDKDLQERLAGQEERRLQRAHKIAQRLTKLGVSQSFELAAKRAPRAVPARPHFAQVLVAQGYCKNVKQAFQRYLAAAKPAYVKTDWPELATGVQWILQAGGVAVLAHPGRYKLTRTKLQRLLAEFVAVGGQGLEVATPAHTPEQVRLLADLAVKFGLYASQGSDYHGTSMPWVKLGYMPQLPSRCHPINELLQ